MSETVTLVECPRDAMQGLHHQVPTQQKVEYLQALLAVGFPVLDCGAFVNPKVTPQMADTPQVLASLSLQSTATELLVIVLNERGAAQAADLPQVAWLGFPWSLSETFQYRNARQTPEEAWQQTRAVARLAQQAQKKLVVYLSMAFGNPYGDAHSPARVQEAVQQLQDLGVQTIALADTVGIASDAPGQIKELYEAARQVAYATVTLGLHLHVHPARWQGAVAAGWQAGCRRWDVALGGYGGCPFAADGLVGNLATERLLVWLATEAQAETGVNAQALSQAQALLPAVFQPH